MAYILLARYGQSAEVPILQLGEFGWDVDTKSLRIGDGTDNPPRIVTSKSTGVWDFRNIIPQFSNEFLENLQTPGPNGWTPIGSLETNGDRILYKILDWVGGSGDKPIHPVYLGSNGYTQNSNLAVDVRGKTGKPGTPPLLYMDINQYGELIVKSNFELEDYPLNAELNENGQLLITYTPEEGASTVLSNLGQIVPIHMGAYDAETEYTSLQEVLYNGSSYRVKWNLSPEAGTLPTDTNYWDLIASGTV